MYMSRRPGHRDHSAPGQRWNRAIFKVGIRALRMKMMGVFMGQTSILVVVIADVFLYYNLPDS